MKKAKEAKIDVAMEIKEDPADQVTTSSMYMEVLPPSVETTNSVNHKEAEYEHVDFDLDN